MEKTFYWEASPHHSYSLDQITPKGGFNCLVMEDERGGWYGSVNRWSWLRLDYVTYMKAAFADYEQACTWCEWVATSRLFAVTTFIRCLLPPPIGGYKIRVVSFTPQSYYDNKPEKWLFDYGDK